MNLHDLMRKENERRQAQADKRRTYRMANKDRMAAYARTYRKTHREQQRAYSRSYYAAHRTQMLDAQKRYNQRRKDSTLRSPIAPQEVTQ